MLPHTFITDWLSHSENRLMIPFLEIEWSPCSTSFNCAEHNWSEPWNKYVRQFYHQNEPKGLNVLLGWNLSTNLLFFFQNFLRHRLASGKTHFQKAVAFSFLHVFSKTSTPTPVTVVVRYINFMPISITTAEQKTLVHNAEPVEEEDCTILIVLVKV